MLDYKVNIYLRHTEMENMYTREIIEIVAQDTKAYTFKFTLYDDESAYDLTGRNVYLITKSTSGTIVQDKCTVTDAKSGLAQITLPNDMFCEEGTYAAEVQIWEGTSRLTSLPFDYTVRLSLQSDRSVIADTRYSLLQEALETVEEAASKSTEALATANEAKVLADGQINTINTASQNAQEALDRATSIVTQEEFAEKVKLNGAATNVDFIERKVVQDGLFHTVLKQTGALGNRVDMASDFTILGTARINLIPTTDTTIVIQGMLALGAFQFSISKEGYYRIGYSDGTTYYFNTSNVKASIGVFDFCLVKKSNILSLFSSFCNISIDVAKMKIDTTQSLATSIANLNGNVDVRLYNRALASQEIQHSFSILNNSPAISTIETTDASSNKTSFLLSSDSEHVEMPNGKTLREFAYQALDWETKTSDGSDITVNNGKEAWVRNAVIKGQTVKNEIFARRSGEYTKDGYLKIADDNTYDYKNLANIQPSTEYTLIFFVRNNTKAETETLYLNAGTSAGWFTDISIKGGENGVFVFNKISLTGNRSVSIGHYRCAGTEIGVVILIGTYSQEQLKHLKAPFTGLSSTQAIISNNGLKYSFYANAEDKANGKAIECHKLGDVADTVQQMEDGSGVYSKKIYYDKLFNVVSTWEKTSTVGTNTTRWYCGLNPAKLDGTVLMTSIPVSSDIVNDDRVCVGTYGNVVALHIRVPNSITTSQQVTEYIKTNYPDEYIAYKLTTPIITTIDKSLMPAILTQLENEFTFGDAVKPSGVEITVPVDKVSELEKRLSAIEAINL